MHGAAGDHGQRVLVFGWGAACEAVLSELAVYADERSAVVSCISQVSQADDCDLRDVCSRLGFACTLCDDDAELVAVSQSFAPTFIISASYRRRLPSSVLGLCAECINFHPSLLPRHRGCWSGFWAIFEGDAETGVTCHRMVEKFDEGRILHQVRMAIEIDDTSISIYKKLLPVTGQCARSVLALYFGDSGLPPGEEQQGPASYHFRKLPFGGLIQPEWSDTQIQRFIRAMHFPPFEGAAVAVDSGRRLEIGSVQEYRRIQCEGLACAAAVECTAVAAAAASAAAASGTVDPQPPCLVQGA